VSLPTLPLPLVTSLNRTLKAAVTPVPSAFTGSEQVQDWGGRWWLYEIEMALTKGADGRRLSGFFAALGGTAGRFLLKDPSAAHQATTPGTPLVSGSSQTGNSLLSAGWVPDTTPLLSGDLFSLDSGAQTRLHQLTADVIADATGTATLSFVPPLREPPLDQAGLNVTTPTVCLRLTSPVPTRIGRADTYRFTLTAREAF
jgi:hypothetical protein